MNAPFDPGMAVEISYPHSTHVRFWRPEDCRKREIVIHTVRDLVTDPLTVAEFMRRPFLLRSRWLVRAFEPKIRQWRQFYMGSSREFASSGALRVGLFEPEATTPTWLYGPSFEPTSEGRRDLIRRLRDWSHIDFGNARLGIFADDR